MSESANHRDPDQGCFGCKSGHRARFFYLTRVDFVFIAEAMAASDTTVIDTVTRLAEPICRELGLELVAVQFRREAVGQVLRIVIHHPDGITVDDCAQVSREMSYILDVEDCIEQAYTLEVTSPGLHWPLVTERDFARYRGKRIDISWLEGEEVQKTRGAIVGVTSEAVTIRDEDGNERRIPLERVKKARLVIEV